jgi:hypothetical protein
MAVTLRPRASSNAPMHALESPLPMDETTPPVIKMYFVERAIIFNQILKGGLMDYTHFFWLSLVPKSRIGLTLELKKTKALKCL